MAFGTRRLLNSKTDEMAGSKWSFRVRPKNKKDGEQRPLKFSKFG